MVNGVLLLSHSDEELQGHMLNRVLRRAGLTREAFAERNTVDGLVGYLQQNPGIKCVFGMGEEVLVRLIGETDIERWRGRPVWLQSYGVWFIPSIAPSKLLPRRSTAEDKKRKKKPLQNPPRFTRVMVLDLFKALEVAKDGFERREQADYLFDPDPIVFAMWISVYLAELEKNPDTLLSFDIETPYKQKNKDEGEWNEADFDNTILRVSFSYKPYHGVTVPWDAAHLEGIRALLGSHGGKVVWNGSTFDVPKVEAKGVKVKGRVYDFMDGWHVLQSDLPKGLEFVTSFYTDLLPWKHKSNSDPQLYSCIDSDAALRCALEIKKDLEHTGQWNTFMRHAVLLGPILYEAGRRGNVIDEGARKELEIELVAEEKKILGQVQGVVPDGVRPRKLYKTRPWADQDDVFYTGSRYVWGDRVFVDKPYNGKVKVCTICQALDVKKGTHFKGGKKNPCKAAGGDVKVIEGTRVGYEELLDFNPNSSDQLIAYMKHHKHPVGRPKDDDDGESADSKHLKSLVKRYGDKHPVYGLTLEAHKLNKALGTYVRGLAPDANGRVYTTYVNSPSTWRLGSRDVNMQNQGKRASNPYAKRARKLIVASPGNVLVQADSSSIEAVFVGHYMGDPDYIALAKKGIHAWLCCKKKGWDFTPENVEIIKTQHKALYDQLKITNHATNYGATPQALLDIAPDTFPTLKSAKEIQQFIFDVLPQLKQWHHEVRVRAQKETFLESPWHHRHYFYDVFTRGWDDKVRYGKDSKRCIAFLPQNGAGSFMRDNLLIMGTTYEEYKANPEWYPWVPEELEKMFYHGFWRASMPANVSVHDGYVLDVPKKWQQTAIQYLKLLLTRPIAELGGLRVGCEIEVGPNWLEMETVEKVEV